MCKYCSGIVWYRTLCTGLFTIVIMEVREHARGKGNSISMISIEGHTIDSQSFALINMPGKIMLLGNVGMSDRVTFVLREWSM